MEREKSVFVYVIVLVAFVIFIGILVGKISSYQGNYSPRDKIPVSSGDVGGVAGGGSVCGPCDPCLQPDGCTAGCDGVGFGQQAPLRRTGDIVTYTAVSFAVAPGVACCNQYADVTITTPDGVAHEYETVFVEGGSSELLEPSVEYVIDPYDSVDGVLLASASYDAYNCVGSVGDQGEGVRSEYIRFGDINGDDCVDVSDLTAIIQAWDMSGERPEDLSGNDVVDSADLSLVIQFWGSCDE
jgi:hypothetical protein